MPDALLNAMPEAGGVPASKILGQWRIKRTELDAWNDARVSVASDPREELFKEFCKLPPEGRL